MGGRVTPGGNGGSSMSLIDDLLRPVREFVCFEVGVAVFDLGRFLNRSLQNEKNEMIILVLMVNLASTKCIIAFEFLLSYLFGL